MIVGNQRKRFLSTLFTGCLVLWTSTQAFAVQAVEIELTAEGKKVCDKYVAMLDKLSTEITASLPQGDPQTQAAFDQARATISALSVPGEDAGPKIHLEFQRKKALAEAKALEAARAALVDRTAVLSDDAMDGKLMRVAILRHGTPAGLAEFAQQGDQEKA
ncbi:hypothetical protein N9Z64_02930, partial [bacterium]|nr:hypothetical protein [bacterium]